MKKQLNLIVITAVVMAVTSCGFFEEEKHQNNESKILSSIEGLAPEIKEHFVAQDSLMKDLVNKVDTLASALNQTQKVNLELKGKIESMKSPQSTWVWMSIGAIVLSVIALLLTLIRRGLNEHEVRAVVKDRLDSSQRIKELIFNVNTLKNDLQSCSRNKQSSSSISQNIDIRLRQIEQTLGDVVNYINGQQQNTQMQTTKQRQNTREQTQIETQRVGYARIDYETYFTTIYESNQEGCAFKITFKNETKGEFTIISLDRISSSNDWQQKIECSGVSIKDASDFRIEEFGVCENIGNNTWQVTKKLKIRLLK
jgi:hypothetical protein